MKIAILTTITAYVLALSGCSAQGQWHKLTRLSASEKTSHSYQFLVGKFGAAHLLTECDTDEAALLGDNYLFQVMGEGDDLRVGETIGHGATLQEALDAAEWSYISPSRVKELRAELAERDKEFEQRKAEYRKKCCRN